MKFILVAIIIGMTCSCAVAPKGVGSTSSSGGGSGTSSSSAPGGINAASVIAGLPNMTPLAPSDLNLKLKLKSIALKPKSIGMRSRSGDPTSTNILTTSLQDVSGNGWLSNNG